MWSQQKDIEIAALNSRPYLTVPVQTLLAGKNAKEVFLFTEVLVRGKRVSSNKHFFAVYKELSLPRPQIVADVMRVPGGFRLTLSADKFARAVYLSTPNYTGSFTDNYFDLIPGRKMEVEYRTGAAISLNDFRSQLKIRSMADAF